MKDLCAIAREAIENVFGEDGIPEEQIYGKLKYLRDEIEMLMETLNQGDAE